MTKKEMKQRIKELERENGSLMSMVEMWRKIAESQSPYKWPSPQPYPEPVKYPDAPYTPSAPYVPYWEKQTWVTVCQDKD